MLNRPVNRSRASQATSNGLLTVAFTAGFLAFVMATVLMRRLPAMVLLVYCGASLAAFIAYALDKSAAKKGLWRIKENTLHWLALLGGWPGALAAQRILRHKSSKASFQAVFRITVLLNCAGFAGLLISQELNFWEFAK